MNPNEHTPPNILNSVVYVCRSTLRGLWEWGLCRVPGPVLGASVLGFTKATQFLPWHTLFYLMFYVFHWTKHPHCQDFFLKCKRLPWGWLVVAAFSSFSSSSDRAPTHKWAVENSLFGRHSPPCPVFLHMIILPVQVQSEHQHPPHCVRVLSASHQWNRTLVLRTRPWRCSRMQTLQESATPELRPQQKKYSSHLLASWLSTAKDKWYDKQLPIIIFPIMDPVQGNWCNHSRYVDFKYRNTLQLSSP